MASIFLALSYSSTIETVTPNPANCWANFTNKDFTNSSIRWPPMLTCPLPPCPFTLPPLLTLLTPLLQHPCAFTFPAPKTSDSSVPHIIVSTPLWWPVACQPLSLAPILSPPPISVPSISLYPVEITSPPAPLASYTTPARKVTATLTIMFDNAALMSTKYYPLTGVAPAILLNSSQE